MAASPSHPSRPSLAELPDDLLTACFAQLKDPLERRRLLPLVCRRWQRLADDQRLTSSLRLEFAGVDSLPRLAALRCWLERSGAGVRSLHLDLSENYDDDTEMFITDDLAQLRSELLGIAASGRGLQQLIVQTDSELQMRGIDVGSFAASAPGLRVLRLHTRGSRLLVKTPMDALGQLRDLRLESWPVQLSAGAPLPPGLTRLHLGSFERGTEAMPAQVSNLPQLAHLGIASLDCKPAGFKMLSRLTSLTALQLSHCLHLPAPAVVRQLSNLCSFAFCHRKLFEAGEQELNAALQALPQLTALLLEVHTPLPPAVAGLARLQRFAWDSGGSLAGLAYVLPSGPWLASLRQAVLPDATAVASLAVLQAAQQLEYLGVGQVARTRPEEGWSTSLLQFASRHPTLRRLELAEPAFVSRGEAAAAAATAPHLSIAFAHHTVGLERIVVPDLADDIWTLPWF